MDPKAGQSDARREQRFGLGFGRGQVRSSLRNLVVYRKTLPGQSSYSSGRIAPVMHHRRPHNMH